MSRLLQVANDPSDEYIKSVIENPFDFEDFNKAVSMLNDIGSHATNPDMLVSLDLSIYAMDSLKFESSLLNNTHILFFMLH